MKKINDIILCFIATASSHLIFREEEEEEEETKIKRFAAYLTSE